MRAGAHYLERLWNAAAVAAGHRFYNILVLFFDLGLNYSWLKLESLILRLSLLVLALQILHDLVFKRIVAGTHIFLVAVTVGIVDGHWTSFI